MSVSWARMREATSIFVRWFCRQAELAAVDIRHQHVPEHRILITINKLPIFLIDFDSIDFFSFESIDFCIDFFLIWDIDFGG